MNSIRVSFFLAVLYSLSGCTDLVNQVGGVAIGNAGYGHLAINYDGSVIAYKEQTGGFSRIRIRDFNSSWLGEVICISLVEYGQGCGNPDVSGSGDLVVFDSLRDNLVPGDTNGERDVFLYRRSTNVTTRISQLPASAGFNRNFNGFSKSPVISSNGKVIAFETNASNVPGYPASSMNTIVLYKVSTGTFTIAPLGAFNSRKTGYQPDLSADGSKLSYSSRASGITSSPSNSGSVMQVYQYDIASKVNTMVSVMPDGTAGLLDSQGSRNSGNGSKVLFFSGSEFLSDPFCSGEHLWVRTMASLNQQRVTVKPDGSCVFFGDPMIEHHVIASDIDDAGEKVVFSANDNEVVESPDVSSQPSQVYWHTLSTGKTAIISTAVVPAPDDTLTIEISNDLSSFARMSGDGKRAAYLSEATNLTEGIYTVDSFNVFRYDPSLEEN